MQNIHKIILAVLLITIGITAFVTLSQSANDAYSLLPSEETKQIEPIRKYKVDRFENNFVNVLGLSKSGRYASVLYKKDDEYFIQVNDSKYGPYDGAWPAPVVFSDQGSRYGWRFTNGNTSYVQINENVYRNLMFASTIRQLAISADGSKYGWEYGRKDGLPFRSSYIKINGQDYGPYEIAEGLTFSADGSTQGWRFSENGSDYIQINDQTYGPYESVSGPSFSDNGTKYIWQYNDGGESYIKFNDLTYGPYKYIKPLVISADGSVSGFGFTKEKESYVKINNQEFGPYQGYISSIALSSDGSKFGWIYGKEQSGTSYIQINEKTFGPYTAWDLTLSADGSKYGWGFKKDGLNYVQINDQTFGPYGSSIKFTINEENKAYITYILNDELVIEELK